MEKICGRTGSLFFIAGGSTLQRKDEGVVSGQQEIQLFAAPLAVRLKRAQ